MTHSDEPKVKVIDPSNTTIGVLTPEIMRFGFIQATLHNHKVEAENNRRINNNNRPKPVA